MIRKILLSASLGALFVASVPAIAHSKAAQNQPSQEQQATKSISGKVASIGDNGKSFVLEVDNGGAKQTMQFVLDKNSQVSGHVGTGSMVLVEYQPSSPDQNLVVKISPKQS